MEATSWHTHRRHPVAEATERLHHELDQLAQSHVWSMSPDELTTTLTSLTRLAARVAELELRVAAGAARHGVGDHVGASSTTNWWAHATRQTRPAAGRKMRLAQALDTDHEPVADALASGHLLLDQAAVIVEAVDALPHDLLDPHTIRRAETHLIALAAEHDATTLKTLGRTILETLAPDVAAAHEQRVLDAEEARARQRVRLTLTDDGHGVTYGRFTIPTPQAQMFRKHLLALAGPHHQPGSLADAATGAPGARLPLPQRLGHAFLEYIERYPLTATPDTGGVSATVVVTMPLDTLQGGLAPAHLDTGATLTAAHARRLACEAGIIPAVLGGDSQILDLGRTRRLHNKPQRITLAHRDKGCTADGCDWPPGLCHVHHDPPWSQGGHTNIKDARLLCPHHHHRAHDPHYTMTKLPGGKVAFTRRT